MNSRVPKSVRTFLHFTEPFGLSKCHVLKVKKTSLRSEDESMFLSVRNRMFLLYQCFEMKSSSMFYDTAAQVNFKINETRTIIVPPQKKTRKKTKHFTGFKALFLLSQYFPPFKQLRARILYCSVSSELSGRPDC